MLGPCILDIALGQHIGAFISIPKTLVLSSIALKSTILIENILPGQIVQSNVVNLGNFCERFCLLSVIKDHCVVRSHGVHHPVGEAEQRLVLFPGCQGH